MDAMLVDAQIIRLYQSFFTRQPDQGGFNYWHNIIFSQAANLGGIAEAFSQSDEFVQTYGGLNDEQFLNLVYQNVLARAPDTEGLAYWSNALSNGLLRGNLMVSFSESTEHVQRSSTGTHFSQLALDKANNKAAVFQQKQSTPLIVGDGTEESSAVTAIDINGDGLLDLLNARMTPILQDAKLPLELFINQGNGQFQAADLSSYIEGAIPALQNTAVMLKADLNGDGIDDLLMAGRQFASAFR